MARLRYVSLGQNNGDRGAASVAGAKLGTYGGVFVPCTLSIFGVILFQRLGWVVGQAGVNYFFVMIFVGYSVVIPTVLSLSALSSNGKLKGGGAYYLISRALGPELGGAIGLIFYGANVAGCVVYLLGFAEEFIDLTNLDDSGWTRVLVAFVMFCVLTAICLVGTSLYSKTTRVIFYALSVCIVLTLISFFAQKDEATQGFTGISSDTFDLNRHAHFTTGNDFANVFAIMFPAVTGIMAGANMSGKLQRPATSIPYGTLWATGLSVIVYTIFALMIAASNKPEVLVTNKGYSVMRRVSVLPASVSLGIFLAVLSSCMGSLLGGAEILQALAQDDILPFLGWFVPESDENDSGATSGTNRYHRRHNLSLDLRLGGAARAGLRSRGVLDEEVGDAGPDQDDHEVEALPPSPRKSILATFVLVSLALCSGVDLNGMATFQTLFFLLSYAIINLACFLLSVQGSPNFRPIWPHYSWHMAFTGFVMCIVVMFYTHPFRAALALFLCMLLLAYLAYRAPDTSWGDVTQSLIFHQVRKYLLRLDPRKEHAKFWRPQILLLTSNPRGQYRLVHFANNLKKGGLLMIGNVLQEECTTAKGVIRSVTRPLVERLQQSRIGWLEYITECHIKAFPVVTAAGSLHSGCQSLLMMAGLGALRPNTVMLEFYDQDITPQASVNTLHLSREQEDGLMNSMHRFPRLDSKNKYPCQSLGDYLRIVKDTLTFGHHLLIARHFHLIPHYLVDGTDPPAYAKAAQSTSRSGTFGMHRRGTSVDIPEMGGAMEGDSKISAGATPDPRNGHWYIDVWYLPELVGPSGAREWQDNTELCLLLGWMLSIVRGRKSGWARYARLRICVVVKHSADKERAEKRIRATLRDARVACRRVLVLAMEEADPGDREKYGFRYDAATARRRGHKSSSLVDIDMAGGVSAVKMRGLGDMDAGGQGATDSDRKAFSPNSLECYNMVMRAESRHTAVAFLPMPNLVKPEDAKAARASGNPDVNTTSATKDSKAEPSGDAPPAVRKRWNELSLLTQGMCPVILCHSHRSPLVRDL